MGGPYQCGKCGRLIARKGPWVVHERACRGPDTGTRKCPTCGVVVPKRSFGGHRVSCLGLNSMADPSKHALAMKKRSKNEAYRKYLAERMRGERNPAKRVDVVWKLRRGWREAHTGCVPYGRGVGGKGNGPTPSEVFLREGLLDLGFQFEFKIVTGNRKGARWYSLDAAHEVARIAVEVDGSSHASRGKTDARKDAFLTGRGWVVVRISVLDVQAGVAWVSQKFSALRQLSPRVIQFSISK